jgi:hypothetical protein
MSLVALKQALQFVLNLSQLLVNLRPGVDKRRRGADHRYK